MKYKLYYELPGHCSFALVDTTDDTGIWANRLEHLNESNLYKISRAWNIEFGFVQELVDNPAITKIPYHIRTQSQFENEFPELLI